MIKIPINNDKIFNFFLSFLFIKNKTHFNIHTIYYQSIINVLIYVILLDDKNQNIK
jgi:hypothetical protein